MFTQKAQSIMIMILLGIVVALFAFNLFGKEEIAGVPVTKKIMGINLSGKPAKVQKRDEKGQLVFEADNKTPVYI